VNAKLVKRDLLLCLKPFSQVFSRFTSISISQRVNTKLVKRDLLLLSQAIFTSFFEGCVDFVVFVNFLISSILSVLLVLSILVILSNIICVIFGKNILIDLVSFYTFVL